MQEHPAPVRAGQVGVGEAHAEEGRGLQDPAAGPRVVDGAVRAVGLVPGGAVDGDDAGAVEEDVDVGAGGEVEPRPLAGGEVERVEALGGGAVVPSEPEEAARAERVGVGELAAGAEHADGDVHLDGGSAVGGEEEGAWAWDGAGEAACLREAGGGEEGEQRDGGEPRGGAGPAIHAPSRGARGQGPSGSVRARPDPCDEQQGGPLGRVRPGTPPDTAAPGLRTMNLRGRPKLGTHATRCWC